MTLINMDVEGGRAACFAGAVGRSSPATAQKMLIAATTAARTCLRCRSRLQPSVPTTAFTCGITDTFRVGRKPLLRVDSFGAVPPAEKIRQKAKHPLPLLTEPPGIVK